MKRQACSKDKRPGKQDKTLSRSIKNRRPESLRMHPLFFRCRGRDILFPVKPPHRSDGQGAQIAWWMWVNYYTPLCEGPAVFPPPLPLGSSSPLLPPPTVPGTTAPNRTAPGPAGPHRPAPRAAPLCHSSATAAPENRITSTKIFNSILNIAELPRARIAAQHRPSSALPPLCLRPPLRPHSAAPFRAQPAPPPRIAAHPPRLLNVRAPYFYR